MASMKCKEKAQTAYPYTKENAKEKISLVCLMARLMVNRNLWNLLKVYTEMIDSIKILNQRIMGYFLFTLLSPLLYPRFTFITTMNLHQCLITLFFFSFDSVLLLCFTFLFWNFIKLKIRWNRLTFNFYFLMWLLAYLFYFSFFHRFSLKVIWFSI